MTSEAQRIALLRAIFDSTGRMIGDDCAVLAPSSASAGSLVWSIDASVEHVHFERAWMTLEDIGWRATMAALSDLAAMGAVSLGGLAALTLPRGFSDEELASLARGQKAACEALGTAIIGGNLARGDALTITTTVLGTAVRPLTRSAATAGAGVFVAGGLGLSAAGLFDAQRAKSTSPAPSDDAWSRARSAFRRPRAQLDAGCIAAAHGAIAAIDVSDGLAADVAHIADESGVAVLLEEALLAPFVAALPMDPALDRLHAVLFGGEDYALVAVATELPAPFVRIGIVVGDLPVGVHLRSIAGDVTLLGRAGFDHFT